MLTEPANFFCTSSTEGASLLQVLQPGAQNHNTTGLRASALDKTNFSPLTVEATKLSTVETGEESPTDDCVVVVATISDDDGSELHDMSPATATARSARPRIFIMSS